MLSGMGARNMRGSHAGSPENPLASLLNLGGGASTLAAIASLAGSQIRDNRRDNRDRDDRGGGGGGSGSGSNSSSSTSYEM